MTVVAVMVVVVIEEQRGWKSNHFVVDWGADTGEWRLTATGKTEEAG